MIVAVAIAAIAAIANYPEIGKRISGLQRDSNPWSLRSRCSALPVEL